MRFAAVDAVKDEGKPVPYYLEGCSSPFLEPVDVGAFFISAPRNIWNSLPTNIREAKSVLTFRRHLKTYYFQSA